MGKAITSNQKSIVNLLKEILTPSPTVICSSSADQQESIKFFNATEDIGFSDTVNFRVEPALPAVTVSLLALIDLAFLSLHVCNGLEDGII
ncbi:hypothetical protein [Prochlorococcus marinus]|uniref:Uncharacterized protein n=1 Tax=Prochlorococcus marinus (strain MIT 9303) TaxID=59922 RepID=A2CDD3_PROM3|nr:hypothetical protein [Prochlorococcus marinus]ABM79493.1 Hypothetical protein P9303_27631 [Prochlorococcus marinus str. MIT 9303]